MSLSKTEVMGEYQSYMGKRLLFFLVLVFGTVFLASIAVTLGVSSAAGFGAALAIVLGAGFVGGEYLIIGNAFIFTLIASFTVYGLAKYKGITPETLILAGIAIMYLFSAMTSFLQYVGHAEQVQEVVFWMMGSLGRSSWEKAGIISAILAVCLPYLIIKSWDINAIGADTLARTVLAPVILPVGIMTSFLGVPFFVYLFMKRRKEFW